MPDGEAIAFFVPPGSARRRQTGAICGVSAAWHRKTTHCCRATSWHCQTR